jgi:hypothetical protein
VDQTRVPLAVKRDNSARATLPGYGVAIAATISSVLAIALA